MGEHEGGGGGEGSRKEEEREGRKENWRRKNGEMGEGRCIYLVVPPALETEPLLATQTNAERETV